MSHNYCRKFFLFSGQMDILILLKCISSQPLLKAFSLERIPLMTLLELLVVMLDFLWDMLWFNFPRPLCHLFHLFKRECQAKCCNNHDENKEFSLINILMLIYRNVVLNLMIFVKDNQCASFGAIRNCN